MDCRSVDELIVAAKAGNRHIQLWEPNDVSNEDVERIAKATQDYPTFTHLGFFRCSLTKEQLAILCQGLSSSIKHLLLQYCNVGDNGVFWISRLLRRKDSCLERLFVCDDIIGDKGVDTLADSLENNKALKLLCITDNMFTNDGLHFLMRTLRKNASLKTLHFSGQNNSILDKSLVSQLSTLSKYPETRADWQRIESLCGLTVNRLAKNSPLRGIPVELIRMVKDMLCEKLPSISIQE